jgi:hypothetical protein
MTRRSRKWSSAAELLGCTHPLNPRLLGASDSVLTHFFPRLCQDIARIIESFVGHIQERIDDEEFQEEQVFAVRMSHSKAQRRQSRKAFEFQERDPDL